MPSRVTSFTEAVVSWGESVELPTIRSVTLHDARTLPLSVDARTQDAISSETDRGAILRALYDDRMELIDLDVLGKLTPSDRLRLHDLEREIDKWEAPDRRLPSDRIWRELEQIATNALDLRAQIQAKKNTK